ncbi:MAG: 4Fe-4S ferredoxin, partial [Lentisphaeria bacterium]|nr:4Fe-4S ferredoxin [Lentisphaeria bacterium]
MLPAWRSYCAAVCPHGAIQDIVLVKAIEVPDWLEHCLGILPFIWLGLGVLYAATGAAYIICDFDPFVALFRLDGNASMLGLGALFLIVGMFIGR